MIPDACGLFYSTVVAIILLALLGLGIRFFGFGDQRIVKINTFITETEYA